MYYFYETKVNHGYYLHRTQIEERAKELGTIVGTADSLEESRAVFFEIISGNPDRYVNSRRGKCYDDGQKAIINRALHTVICDETGETYPNATRLAEEIGYTKQNVSLAIKYHRAIKGLHYSMLNKTAVSD